MESFCKVCKHAAVRDFVLIASVGMQKRLDESLPGGEVINRANIFGFVGVYPATRHVVWSFRGTQGPDVDNWFKLSGFL
jgi:hypothetical protein